MKPYPTIVLTNRDLGDTFQSSNGTSYLHHSKVPLCFKHTVKRILGKLSVLKAFNIIPTNFLKRIVSSNFRDMRNLMPVVWGLIKNVVLGTKNKSAMIFGKAIRPKRVS